MTVDFAQRASRPNFGTGKIWELAIFTHPSGSVYWTDIAFARTHFVAVSNSGILNNIARSIDGYNWSILNSSSINFWNAIAYGSNILNCCSTNGVGNQFQRSTDFGLTWSPIAEPANLQWVDLCYCGNSTWVAIAQNGVGNQIARSIDNGLNWASIAEPATLQWTAVKANPVTGIVIAVASNGVGNQIARSTDRGATWGSIAEPVNDTWSDVQFGNNVFVAVANSITKNLMYSLDDGATWTASFTSNNSCYKVGYGNNMFVTAAYSTSSSINCPYSINGLVWSHIKHEQNGAVWTRLMPTSIAYGNNRWVISSQAFNIFGVS